MNTSNVAASYDDDVSDVSATSGEVGDFIIFWCEIFSAYRTKNY